MGYTHYWKITGTPTDAAWDRLLADTEVLIGLARLGDVAICGGDGDGDPVLDYDAIWLNGDRATDQDYETFELSRDITTGAYEFCKTGRRPYDALVAAILVRAHHHLGDHRILIATDGAGEDWALVQNLLIRAFPGSYTGNNEGLCEWQISRILTREQAELVAA